MKMDGRLLILFASLVITVAYDYDPLDTKKVDCKPEQVHLAFGDSLTDMVVMWSTPTNCSSIVKFGKKPWGFNTTVAGKMVFFGDIAGYGVPYIHRVILQDLQESTTYFYSVVSDDVSSDVFFFETPAFGSDWSPEFMVYGDLGIHTHSIPLLTTEARKGVYTAVLHVGDFGYNLENIVDPSHKENMELPNLTDKLDNSTTTTTAESTNTTDPPPITNPVATSVTTTPLNKAKVGDIFVRNIEGMAAYVPYMTSPGNHEIDGETFNQYRYRFSMPNADWPMPVHKLWYSLNIGPVHFLSYSTEVFFTNGGAYTQSQRDWILADLQTANENRQNCPWIIALGHRPMYCSNNDDDDCTKEDSQVRAGFEDLFYTQGVDIVLQAHEHSYERMWPMYKGVVLSTNYTNPPAPVQIVTGAAGNKFGADMMKPVNNAWSAFRMDNKALNSYGRLSVKNRTHIYWEQINVEDNSVLDAIWIIQQSHGPFKQESLQPEVKQKISEQIKHDNDIKKENGKPTINNNIGDGSGQETISGGVNSAIWNTWSKNKTRIAIGVSFGAFVVLFLLVVCIVYRCRRKSRSYRRWETLDYGKKFYSTVRNDEKDMDDFEVEVNDGTTKLLTSNGAE